MLSKVYYRAISGHPMYMNVNLFYRKVDGCKHYLTVPFQKNRNEIYNVIFSTSNDHVRNYIQTEYECEVEDHPITVAKHIAQVTQTHLIHVQTFTCDRHTSELEWELYYYVPPGIPVQVVRNMIQNE